MLQRLTQTFLALLLLPVHSLLQCLLHSAVYYSSASYNAHLMYFSEVKRDTVRWRVFPLLVLCLLEIDISSYNSAVK